MMRWLLLGIVAVIAGFLVFTLQIKRSNREVLPVASETTQAVTSGSAEIISEKLIFATPVHPLARSLGDVAVPKEKEPEVVLELFEAWRRQTGAFPTAEDNHQLVSMLQGQNSSRIRMFPDEHIRINEKGELVDGWGTPYFFHHISSQHIEIRSSGPDQKIYTEDDVVVPKRPDAR